MSSARHAEPISLRAGAHGAGGYHAAWEADSADGGVAAHIEFQYAGMAHQSETALAGMWLFLATEVLFFGGLFLLYMIYRLHFAAAVAGASRQTELAYGTVNTVLLLTSSLVYTYGLDRARRGDNRRLLQACLVTMALGLAFLVLKGFEWNDDIGKNLFPGGAFAIGGPLSGGEQLFWSFYWVATGLHGLHMIAGIILVGIIAVGARRGRYSPGYHTPVEVTGLYWSFVDMVWLVLYPLIYLVDRGGT